MNATPANAPDTSARLEQITNELREMQDSLLSHSDLDPRLLADFREAVNRVRTTAWAMQQYAESKVTDQGPGTVLSLLAGERVRAVYQLCRLVQADLDNKDIRFPKGQLHQMRAAVQNLAQKLASRLGE